MYPYLQTEELIQTPCISRVEGGSVSHLITPPNRNRMEYGAHQWPVKQDSKHFKALVSDGMRSVITIPILLN